MKGKVKETEEVGSWIAGYWVPKEHFEINVWHAFSNRFKKVISGKIKANKRAYHIREGNTIEDVLQGKADIYIGVADATRLSFIPDNSIDLVFTDPPHLDSVPYMELSVLWASWLKYSLNFENEIVVSDSPERNKGLDNYFMLLSRAICEMYRVLKPGGYLVMIFNTADLHWWSKLIEIFTNVGFEFVASASYKSSHPSVVQLSRNMTLKGDIYVIFKKTQSCITNTKNKIKAHTHFSILKDLEKQAFEIISSENGISTEKLIARLIAYMLKKYNCLPIQASEIVQELKKKFIVINGNWYAYTQRKINEYIRK